MRTVDYHAIKKLTKGGMKAGAYLTSAADWSDMSTLSYVNGTHTTAATGTVYTADHLQEAASVLVTFKTVTLAGTKLWLCDFQAPATPDQQEGYRAEIVSTTNVKLYRIDAGVDTELVSYTIPTALSATDWHTLMLGVDRAGVYVDLNGTSIITSTDLTQRRTDWHVQWTFAAICYFRAFHILDNGEYFASGMEPFTWTNTTTDITSGQDGLTFPEDYDGWAPALDFPKYGYDLYFDLRPGLTTEAFGSISFTGAGLNDMGISGCPVLTIDTAYRVKIDASVPDPDTFTWSNDGGATWEAAGVACSTLWTHLENGVYIKFAAVNGHTVDDYWDVTAESDHDFVKLSLDPPKGSGGIYVRMALVDSATETWAVELNGNRQIEEIDATNLPLRWQVLEPGAGTTMYLDNDAGGHLFTLTEGASATRRLDWFIHLLCGKNGASLYKMWAEENSISAGPAKAVVDAAISQSLSGVSDSGSTTTPATIGNRFIPGSGWTY